MKREIKFRAWKKKEKRMFTWMELQRLPLSDLERTDLEWLQFTGLIDKNGKEIYEGDLVADTSPMGEENEIIEWNDGYAGFQAHGLKTGRLKGFAEKIEIIGNIHENPELLNP
jgi:hypothetical protein